MTNLGSRIEESWVIFGVLLTIKGEEGVHTQYEISCLRPDLMEVGRGRDILSLPFLEEQEHSSFFFDTKVVSTHCDLPKDQFR